MEQQGDSARFEGGLAQYRKVYGEEAFAFEEGQSAFFDLMIEQLFGEVWTRPGLEIEQRRLIVMGVLAAQHHFATLQTQFTRALQAGEITADQVREIVIHLVPYVGYPSSTDLFRVGEAAIAAQGAAG